MQTHLVRCRRQHLDAEKTSCAYNSKHVVPKPELKFHLDTCPDRKNMDKFVYVREDVNCNKYEMPKVEVTFDEVWDDVSVILIVGIKRICTCIWDEITEM